MGLKSQAEAVEGRPRPAVASWLEPRPALSIEMIGCTGAELSAAVLDVGGAASNLVDYLIDLGYEDLTVLDRSRDALDRARQRLGSWAGQVQWIHSELIGSKLPPLRYDIWHDRSMFLRMTQPETRKRYVELVWREVKPEGHVIIATPGPDGELEIEGEPVVRFSPDQLVDELGPGFELLEHCFETLPGPNGMQPGLLYSLFRKE
ncbi:MAG: methyltransferase domain-containing protein [Thermoanaerobaculia bacterium]